MMIEEGDAWSWPSVSFAITFDSSLTLSPAQFAFKFYLAPASGIVGIFQYKP